VAPGVTTSVEFRPEEVTNQAVPVTAHLTSGGQNRYGYDLTDFDDIPRIRHRPPDDVCTAAEPQRLQAKLQLGRAVHDTVKPGVASPDREIGPDLLALRVVEGPGRDLKSIPQSELPQDGVDVGCDRPGGKLQRVADLAVGQALGNQASNRTLGRSERTPVGKRCAASGLAWQLAPGC
jgi:hypothetical protein